METRVEEVKPPAVEPKAQEVLLASDSSKKYSKKSSSSSSSHSSSDKNKASEKALDEDEIMDNI